MRIVYGESVVRRADVREPVAAPADTPPPLNSRQRRSRARQEVFIAGKKAAEEQQRTSEVGKRPAQDMQPTMGAPSTAHSKSTAPAPPPAYTAVRASVL